MIRKPAPKPATRPQPRPAPKLPPKPSPKPAPTRRDQARNEIVLSFAGGKYGARNDAEAKRIADKYNLSLVGSAPPEDAVQFYQFRVNGDLSNLAGIRNEPGIRYVEPSATQYSGRRLEDPEHKLAYDRLNAALSGLPIPPPSEAIPSLSVSDAAIARRGYINPLNPSIQRQQLDFGLQRGSSLTPPPLPTQDQLNSMLDPSRKYNQEQGTMYDPFGRSMNYANSGQQDALKKLGFISQKNFDFLYKDRPPLDFRSLPQERQASMIQTSANLFDQYITNPAPPRFRVSPGNYNDLMARQNYNNIMRDQMAMLAAQQASASNSQFLPGVPPPPAPAAPQVNQQAASNFANLTPGASMAGQQPSQPKPSQPKPSQPFAQLAAPFGGQRPRQPRAQAPGFAPIQAF